MSFQIIASKAELVDLIPLLTCSEILYLDTEFVRERTLYPLFGLLQLSDGESTWLVDPVAVGDMSPLWPVLQDPQRLIVLHAFSEDLELLWNQGQVELVHVLDTQVAATLLGWGNGLGFAALVKQVTDVELDKSHSRTNWLHRPLTEEQLRYAADDVIYLAPVAQKLIDALHQNKLWHICMDECQRLAKRTQKPIETRYFDVKNAWQLNRQQLAVLRDLACWRYEQAQQRDMALSFVIKDEALLAIAKHQPDSLNQLRQLEDVTPLEVRIHGSRLLQLVEKSKQCTKDEWPDLIQRPIDIPQYKNQLKSLGNLIKSAAEQHSIPDTAIASKRLQTEYLMWCWQKKQGKETNDTPVILQGWRKSLLEPALLAWQAKTN